MENYYTPIFFNAKPIAKKQERVHAISVVLPDAGVSVKTFTDERENIIDQKITGG